MRLARARGIVCLVTDRTRLLPDGTVEAQLGAVVAQAAAAAAAGVDLFQVRERDLTDRRLHALVREVVTAVAGSEMRVMVNDRLDVAVSAGAHGVHVPSSGLAVPAIRDRVPEGWIIGQSIHGSDVPDAAADFAIFGTVFPTGSKPAGHRWAGVDALASASRRSPVPVLAIGGITEGTLGHVAQVSSGIAAIGWLATTDAHRLAETVAAVRTAFDTITPVI
jgi:thiamine-phosphate pyrophosphorylase